MKNTWGAKNRYIKIFSKDNNYFPAHPSLYQNQNWEDQKNNKWCPVIYFLELDELWANHLI
jgi:hypothetical protein